MTDQVNRPGGMPSPVTSCWSVTDMWCGGIVNPYNTTQKIKDELVIGLRTNITF